MNGPDRVALLIPWYATGRLGAAEAAEVERHLGSCDDCRDLLELAQGFRRLGPGMKVKDLFDHVHPQHLVEFAEDPSAPDPEARRFITSHLRSCAPCTEALGILEGMGSSQASKHPAGDPQRPTAGFADTLHEAWADLWSRLGRTVLHPGAAVAYLAALVVVLTSLPLRAPSPGPAVEPPPPSAPPVEGPSARPSVSLLPPAIVLPEEMVYRDGRPAPAPLVVTLPSQAEAVPLVLATSLEPAEMRDPAAVFR